MRISALTGLLSAAALTLSISATSSPVFAQAPVAANGYVQSAGGSVRSGAGSCVRTGYWTPSSATEECDPDLLPKKTPVAAPPPPPPPPPPGTTPGTSGQTAAPTAKTDRGKSQPAWRHAV